ncbi:MAG: DNA translocase FtsK [Bacteroidales bacterium]|nr:DNA translocase FtsK [Bacteroidales bacterium]
MSIEDLGLKWHQRLVAFLKHETLHFLIGLGMVILAGFFLISYVSFFFTGAADQSLVEGGDVVDLSATDNGIQNYAGSWGARLSNFLMNDCFGLSSIFIFIFLAIGGLHFMKVKRVKLWKWFLSCFALLIWFSLFLGFTLMPTYKDSFIYLGGLHGYNVSLWLISQIGIPGVILFLLGSGLAILVLMNKKAMGWIRYFFSFSYLKKKKKEDKDLNEESEEKEELEDDFIEDEVEEEEKVTHNIELEIDIPVEPIVKVNNNGKAEEKKSLEDDEPNFQVEVAKENEEYEERDLQPYNPKLDLEHYRLPTLDLLKDYVDSDPTINMEEQNENKNKIINTLKSFGIEINTIKATVGPTVTLYEITPERGVRISKIRGLEDDIALSLSALGIRIIAPIPGKGTIGIEVPNSDPKIVSGRSILGTKLFRDCNYELPVAFGKTITNEVFMVDLSKMPHILVAGATGQGKSVGLNTLIASLLYKKHPAELKFVLIDPKKVEFSIYSAIEKHFLAKLPQEEEAIITDVNKVVQTLNSVCVEMDSRYDLLKSAHVRNIKEYNKKFINRQLNPNKGHKYMPYIVVVIDEFGDLIMTAGKDIELPIARIAQLARAVGIHMVIATQRPTTNIITGTIKANFPARVAFRVSSMMDSRTILDRPGANQLIGRGDMLFLQGADPIRVQCAFIDTPEVDSIVQYIAKQQGYTSAFDLPEYQEEADLAPGEIDLNNLDPLFDDAAMMVVIQQQGSTSMLQRKFSIGYNRAGRIMDQLEAAGVVGPSEGSKPREVLCSDEADLSMKLNNL